MLTSKQRAILRGKANTMDQKLLRYTAFLRNRRIETPPFQILHFMNYLTIYPMMRKYAHGYMNDKQRNGD